MSRLSLRLVSSIAACTVVAGLAVGCTSPRSDLGTSDSSCYLALPVAVKAVGSHARLLGAHLFTLAELRKKAPRLVARMQPKGSPHQQICVLAFSGHFTTGELSKPHGRPAGPVAIVVLTSPSNAPLGTLILKRVPLRFSHSHVG